MVRTGRHHRRARAGRLADTEGRLPARTALSLRHGRGRAAERRPCPSAAHVIAACSTSISDRFTIKPKLHDHYTQQARIWVCVVKKVGARGTDMLHSAIWPLKERNAELHKTWTAEHAQWKAGKGKKGQGRPGADASAHHDQRRHRRKYVEILKHGSGTSKLGAIYDELVTFLGGFGRYSDNGGGAARVSSSRHMTAARSGSIASSGATCTCPTGRWSWPATSSPAGWRAWPRT